MKLYQLAAGLIINAEGNRLGGGYKSPGADQQVIFEAQLKKKLPLSLIDCLRRAILYSTCVLFLLCTHSLIYEGVMSLLYRQHN